MDASDYAIRPAQQIRMLRKLLLYWDGQWFLKTVDAFGLGAAIDVNARVRSAFGSIEMRTLLKTLGKRQARDLPDAMRMLETYAEVFMGGTLRAQFAAADADHAEVIVLRCAAFEGAKRAGLPRSDQACVACENLWSAWLETLLPDAEAIVNYPQRQGMGDPRCRFTIEIRDQAPTTR